MWQPEETSAGPCWLLSLCEGMVSARVYGHDHRPQRRPWWTCWIGQRPAPQRFASLPEAQAAAERELRLMLATALQELPGAGALARKE